METSLNFHDYTLVMALVQLLVANGIQDREIQNRRTREFIRMDTPGSIQWNSTKRIVIQRSADCLKKIFLDVKVGPAPAGYRWKRCWPFHFIKKLNLTIGHESIWETGTHILQMEHLIHGLQRSPDWLSSRPGTPLESLTTSPESIFDFDEEERTRRSAYPHDVSFEPLNLTSLMKFPYNIPMICLAFHDVRLDLTTGSLIDCLEPIAGEIQGQLQADLIRCEFLYDMTFLDTEERRALCHNHHAFQTKHLEYCSEVFPFNQEISTSIAANLICSAAYLWITDENNKEIPTQIVEELCVRFNGEERHRLSGHQSRFQVPDTLPHPTLANTKSQNLYYISYHAGNIEANGLEDGANFSRLDHYDLRIRCREGAPQRIKLHMIHRSQNELRIQQGMAGIRFSQSNFSFFERGQAPQAREIPVPRIAAVLLPEFPNADQQIDIQEDDKTCLITYQDFNEGDVVQQCLGCKKVMTSEALDRWYSLQPANKSCVHCRQPYSLQTFRKGKAHLIQTV